MYASNALCGLGCPAHTFPLHTQAKPVKAPELPDIDEGEIDVDDDDFEFIQEYGDSAAFLERLDAKVCWLPVSFSAASQCKRQDIRYDRKNCIAEHRQIPHSASRGQGCGAGRAEEGSWS